MSEDSSTDNDQTTGNDQNSKNVSKNQAGEKNIKSGKILKTSPLLERDIDMDETKDIVEDIDLNQSNASLNVESAEIERLKAEASENYDRYIRSLAELENYKKRALKERSELIKYQGERIFADFLGFVDDMERALQFKESDPQQLIAGFEMIYQRFNEILGRWEVRGETQVGKQFDPNIHNALAKAPSEEHPQGIIINELKKPYFYKDKLIRPGEVVVSDGAPSSSADNAAKSQDPE